jgi:hypothetical protein
MNGVLIAGTVVVAATLGAEIALTDSHSGLPIDLGFVNARIAENLVHGDGFAFNPGESLAVTGSPLWVLLLSVPVIFGATALAAAKILSAFSLLLAGLGAARLSFRFVQRGDLALLTGFAVLLSGRILYAAGSGTEVLAFAAVTLFAIESAIADGARTRGREIRLGIWLAAAALLHPAGFLLFGAWLLHSAVSYPPFRLRAPALPTVLAFLALTAPWVAFCVATTGGAAPTLVGSAPGVPPAPAWKVLGEHALALFESNPLLALGFPIGLFLAIRALTREPRWRLPVLWVVAFSVAGAFLFPAGPRGGALVALLPLELCLGGIGLAFALGKIPGKEAVLKPLLRIAFVIVLLGGAYGAIRFVPRLAEDVTHVNKMLARMGAWARTKTPKDALIASAEVGALGYVGQRRILDLTGGVTPEIKRALAGRSVGGDQDSVLFPILARERPAYLVVYPSWYPHLTARPDLFEPAGLLRDEAPRPDWPSLLVAYRAHWDRYTPAEPLALADAENKLTAIRASVREGRGGEALERLTELEARGPLDREWRRRLYVVRAESALAQHDCQVARKSLVQLDWLDPPPSFRSREAVDALERRARDCRS